MPFFQMNTNLPSEKIPDEFEPAMVELLHKQLYYPKKGFGIHVNHSLRLYFGHTKDPAIVAFMNAVGNMSPERNKEHSVVITKKLTELTGVPSNRIVIYFKEWTAEEVGYDGLSAAGLVIPTSPVAD